jgi:proteolipid membrane potential modulator
MATFWTIAIIVIIAGILLSLKDRAGNKIICPNQNCGFKGIGKASGGKSLIILLLLLFLGILPGLLYAFWPIKQHLACPRCGMQIR